MAFRPVFLPRPSKGDRVLVAPVEFRWHPGMAKSQKQKSIDSLHQSAMSRFGIQRVLEISSKSKTDLGVALSAFNLMFSHEGRQVCVEVAFQSSKRFINGGPFRDLIAVSAREAKKDERLRHAGRLRDFLWNDGVWALEPPTAFYDWIYLNALAANQDAVAELLTYEAFTDIEFNPERSINCQARAAAFYVALNRELVLEDAMASQESFLKYYRGLKSDPDGNGCLF